MPPFSLLLCEEIRILLGKVQVHRHRTILEAEETYPLVSKAPHWSMAVQMTLGRRFQEIQLYLPTYFTAV